MAQSTNGSGIPADLQAKLWSAADKLRGHLDAAEYKHVVLGIIFLKYISDSFQDRYDLIKANPESYDGEEEDRDAYTSENVFRVPKEARWSAIQNNAKKSEIGVIIDEAMHLIEKENPTLK